MRLMSRKDLRAFTLIELLVVIAIIAIMAVVVVLTLNPAELLKQSRDSDRLSDAASMRSALSFYLTDVSSNPVLANRGYGNCYVSASVATTTSNCGVYYTNGYANTSTAAGRNVDGTGWLPVNFNQISTGAPFGELPIDPINNQSYYYTYVASSSLTWEINMFIESNKYKYGGPNDVVSTDGGNSTSTYEVSGGITNQF
jgi:prepilin-type N-terminal cleavage/methylation domain-containing protein